MNGQPDEFGEGSRRRRSSREIGGDDAAGLELAQGSGSDGSLGDTYVIEGNIGLPLESAIGIPCGSSVSPQDNATCIRAHELRPVRDRR